jgi:predicted CoA-substrate-specific enzyme activase
MICAGLDVGSRTIVLVTMDGGVAESAILETGVDPLRRCRELLAARDYSRLVVTGYGRHLVASALGGEVTSEIRAYAVGARHLYPDCRTVIDVGGQDTKVTLLSDEGEVLKFEMNDRCAAGSGKFLEVMAKTLEVDIGDLGALALNASRVVRINSLCTVFAESEVVSLISRGVESSAIASALHEAIAARIATMVRRIGPKERVVFAGGAALNTCLHRLLREKLGVDVTIPPEPQVVGAIGATLMARSNAYPRQAKRLDSIPKAV